MLTDWICRFFFLPSSLVAQPKYDITSQVESKQTNSMMMMSEWKKFIMRREKRRRKTKKSSRIESDRFSVFRCCDRIIGSIKTRKHLKYSAVNDLIVEIHQISSFIRSALCRLLNLCLRLLCDHPDIPDYIIIKLIHFHPFLLLSNAN